MSGGVETSAQAAEWDAAKTIARLFHCLDDGDYDGVAAQFAQDGLWVRMGKNLVGPDAVRAAMAARPPILKTRHLVTNVLADAQPDGSVAARYTITVFDALHDADGPAPLLLPSAIFATQDRLVSTDAGWRFASRQPILVFKRP